MGGLEWTEGPNGWTTRQYTISQLDPGWWVVVHGPEDRRRVVGSSGSLAVARLLALHDVRARHRRRRLQRRALIAAVTIGLATAISPLGELATVAGLLIVLAGVTGFVVTALEYVIGRPWEYVGQTYQ